MANLNGAPLNLSFQASLGEDADSWRMRGMKIASRQEAGAVGNYTLRNSSVVPDLD